MGRLIKAHQPCDDCGSSDGLTYYDDGTHCFVCNTSHITKDLTSDTQSGIIYLSKEEEKPLSKNLSNLLSLKDNNISMKEYRKISNTTLLKYNVLFKDDKLYYPYNLGKGYKVRGLKDKSFYTEGSMKDGGLFGKELFPKSSSKIITITEGENDSMAVHQMNGGYPAVSVKSASSARRDCQTEYDYLNSFDQIYLCFDNDEPGQKAVKEVASLFNPNKIFHVKLSKHKDPHAYLESGDVVLFNKEWWAAKPYLPAGIIGDYKSIEEILAQETAQPVATYPYSKLQDMTYGIRLGEVNLFTAQEKIGKTEFIRSIEHHLLKTTDYNLGIIHLEEPEKRTIQGLVGYELGIPVHLPDSNVSQRDCLDVFKGLTKRDNRCYLYKHFGSDDPQVILETIRYLVGVCDCKFIFLDHITMLVTGHKGDDERKVLDYLSTQLAMLTRELNFTLFLISHVNDDGKTRGSRNISKIADLIVHLERDIEASSIDVRNKTSLMVKGNRWAGISGPSSVLWFDQSKFTYKELELETGTEVEEPIQSNFYNESGDPRPTSLWTEGSRSETSWPTQATLQANDRLLPTDPPQGTTTLGLQGVETQGSILESSEHGEARDILIVS